MDVNSNKPGLYLSQDRSSVIPISLIAFSGAQGRKNTIRKKNIGCIVIQRDGQCCEVAQIRFLHLYGDGVFRKLVSLLTSAYAIETEFRSATLDLSDVKNIVTESVKADSRRGDKYFSSSGHLDATLSAIASADSYEELFQALRIDDENQLDVLSQ